MDRRRTLFGPREPGAARGACRPLPLLPRGAGAPGLVRRPGPRLDRVRLVRHPLPATHLRPRLAPGAPGVPRLVLRRHALLARAERLAAGLLPGALGRGLPGLLRPDRHRPAADGAQPPAQGEPRRAARRRDHRVRCGRARRGVRAGTDRRGLLAHPRRQAGERGVPPRGRHAARAADPAVGQPRRTIVGVLAAQRRRSRSLSSATCSGTSRWSRPVSAPQRSGTTSCG